jgi:thioredoxin 1
MPKEIKSIEEFEAEIKKGNVVCDFFATWCMPCRHMGEVIDTVEPNHPEVKFIKVDVDKLPEIAQRYSVYSIPQVNFFKDGQEADMFVGFHYQADFEDRLKKNF